MFCGFLSSNISELFIFITLLKITTKIIYKKKLGKIRCLIYLNSLKAVQFNMEKNNFNSISMDLRLTRSPAVFSIY